MIEKPARMMRLGLLAMVCTAGCAKKPPAFGPTVERIRWEGAGLPFSATGGGALKNAMAHPKPGTLPLIGRRVPLEQEVLEADRTRVAVYLAEQGYFDAQVDFETEEVRPATDNRPPIMRIHGTVELGPAYPVDQADATGLDVAPSVSRPATAGRFTTLDYDTYQSETLDELRDEGFAYAAVEGTVQVDRAEKHVSVEHRFEAGQEATFGEVTIEGAEDLPQGIVQHAIRIEPGTPYDLESQLDTKQRLYGLDAFSFVTITPDLEDPDRTDVPVHIEVEKRKPRSIAGGVGVSLQNGRQQALGRFGVHHRNAFDRLVRLRFEAEGGLALLATSLGEIGSFKDTRKGFVVDTELGVEIPGVVFPGWALDHELSYRRNLTRTFAVDQPTATLSYGGPLHEHLRLSFAYRLRYARYSQVEIPEEQLRAETRNFDLADGSYFLTELQQSLIFDTRDQPLQPRTGMRHELLLSEAGRFLGGNYDYLGARLDLRGYQSLEGLNLPWVVLAGRVGGGALMPYGPDSRRSVPVAERLYLGGAESVRGWVYQHLGPSVDIGGGETVPVGGQLSSYASAEIRVANDMFGGVLFSDWGMVWADRQEVGEVPLLTPSVGVGGRVITPAGPVRLDIAMRTDRQERFAQEPRVWFHLGIGEAF